MLTVEEIESQLGTVAVLGNQGKALAKKCQELIERETAQVLECSLPECDPFVEGAPTWQPSDAAALREQIAALVDSLADEETAKTKKALIQQVADAIRKFEVAG